MGRSQVYNRQYYFELGKSIGSTGSPLFEEEGARGWQVRAMREGHMAGVAAKMAFDAEKEKREKSTTSRAR